MKKETKNQKTKQPEKKYYLYTRYYDDLGQLIGCNFFSSYFTKKERLQARKELRKAHLTKNKNYSVRFFIDHKYT